MVCTCTAFTFTFLGVLIRLKISYFSHGKSSYLGSPYRGNCIFKYNQQDATSHNLFFFFCHMLYMFQAVPPPIIRSSKLCIQHRVLCQTFTATCHCHGRVATPLILINTVKTETAALKTFNCSNCDVQCD